MELECGHQVCRPCFIKLCNHTAPTCSECNTAIERQPPPFVYNIKTYLIGLLAFSLLVLCLYEQLHRLALETLAARHFHKEPPPYLFLAPRLLFGALMVTARVFLDGARFLYAMASGALPTHWAHVTEMCQPDGLGFKYARTLNETLQFGTPPWTSTQWYMDGHSAYVRDALCTEYTLRMLYFILVLCALLLVWWRARDWHRLFRHTPVQNDRLIVHTLR